MQADAYAQSQGLTLVGYYHANECISDVELGPLGKRIADRIHSHTPEACALLVRTDRQELVSKASAASDAYAGNTARHFSTLAG